MDARHYLPPRARARVDVLDHRARRDLHRQLSQAGDLTDRRRRQLQNVLQFARRTTSEDFIEGEPHLVVIDRRALSWRHDGEFDYVGFLMAEGIGFAHSGRITKES